MRIILSTTSELGNRLGPIISIYRICKKYNIDFLLYWPRQTFNIHNKSVNFAIAFESIFSIEKITLIDNNIYMDYYNNSKSYILRYNSKISNKPVKKNDGKLEGYGIIDLNIFNNYENLILENYTHLFGLPTDPMDKWIPYTKKMGIYIEDVYIKELKACFKDFIIHNNIKNIYSEILSKFSTNMLGVQIRGDDKGGIKKEKQGTYQLLINKIGDHLQKKDSKIFLTTLHEEYQIDLLNKFPDKIIINDKLDKISFYNNRSDTGNLYIAIANLILLSKCNYIIGSAGSSYSFLSWIFGDCNTYETILGYPDYN